MSKWQISVFAAACAQRLLPLYRRYRTEAGASDGIGIVTDALDLLWQDLGRNSLGRGDLERLITECTAEIPPEDRPSTNIWQSYAEYSVIAAIYALTHRLEGTQQDAIWAARQAHEAVYFQLRSRDTTGLDSVESIDASSEMQTELRRQDEDLNLLVASRDSGRLLERIRSLAEQRPTVDPRALEGPDQNDD
jgi:uncharacterized protein YjaG (DUF416 family)